MRIGILTGGGDCPGLNAVIRAVHRRCHTHGHELIGFKYGWRGLLEDVSVPLEGAAVAGILQRGGTILLTSGDNPLHTEDGPARVMETARKHGLDGLIVIGGEGTMRGGLAMWEDHGLPVIGVPKTIDNDLPGTDLTFGFSSALAVATEALDRLHTTAESHDRVMVCEVMGRTAGWLALYSGIAAGANVILMPELEMTIEEAAKIITDRRDSGRTFSIVVVGEGYELRSSTGAFDHLQRTEHLDAYGYPRLGGVSHYIAEALEDLTGLETRVTILGHTQRGGSPMAMDRVLASRFGHLAADLAHNGSFGMLTALRGQDVVGVPLSDAAGPARVVTPDMVQLAREMMG